MLGRKEDLGAWRGVVGFFVSVIQIWILGMKVCGFLCMYRGTSLIRKRPPPRTTI